MMIATLHTVPAKWILVVLSVMGALSAYYWASQLLK
jgi:hypothetical protein